MLKNFRIIACSIICVCLGACSNENEDDEEWLPEPQIAIQCDEQKTNSLTITYIPDTAATGYYYSLGTDPYAGIKVENGKKHSVIYANLSPNTDYTFTAVAWNKKGKEGAISTLYTRTKNDNYTNYFIFNGQKYELLNAKMLIEINWSTSDWEKGANYKILRFEGEKGITVSLQEKYPQQVIPYTNKWKAGSYSVTNSEDYHVYTCSVNMFSQPFFTEGTILLSYYYNENILSASLDCEGLQGHYSGEYTLEDTSFN